MQILDPILLIIGFLILLALIMGHKTTEKANQATKNARRNTPMRRITPKNYNAQTGFSTLNEFPHLRPSEIEPARNSFFKQRKKDANRAASIQNYKDRQKAFKKIASTKFRYIPT